MLQVELQTPEEFFSGKKTHGSHQLPYSRYSYMVILGLDFVAGLLSFAWIPSEVLYHACPGIEANIYEGELHLALLSTLCLLHKVILFSQHFCELDPINHIPIYR